MAYDQGLEQRIQDILDELQPPQLVAKKMFGGVGFMVQGNMACGVHKDKLIVRIGPERHAWGIKMPHTLPFDITGKVMKGWVMVVAEGCESDKDLYEWVEQGVDFALSLPPK